MKITLTTRYPYETSCSRSYDKLANYIPLLHRRNKTDELENIKQQIENAPTITQRELDLYQLIAPNQYHLKTLHYRYCNADDIQQEPTAFTFINDGFYPLPSVEKPEDLRYSLITKLLYENMRNNWSDEPCLALRRMIKKISGKTNLESKFSLFKDLETAETSNHTYYGEYLSDSSDSEEERKFSILTAPKKTKKLLKAKEHRERANYNGYTQAMNGRSNSPTNDCINRPRIHRSESFNRRQAEADLKLINEKLSKGETLSSEFLDSLETQFNIAQYRGIHYLTNLWDTEARRQHRKTSEIDKAQFSSSVLRACGVNNYHELIDQLKTNSAFEQTLIEQAEDLERRLLIMQHTDPASYDGYLYLSLFHILQYWYSYSYDTFPDKIRHEFEKEQSFMTPYLINSDRPLVSTGDIPYHALKYAYGIKLYKGHEAERLRPRWRRDGRAERPYSGKVYVSLHPLTDYLERKPSHITSDHVHGLNHLTYDISPERETSFLGFLPPERIKIEHVAQYPSFNKSYSKRYEIKYGLTETTYNRLKEHFNSFPPHSTERRKLKEVLGQYLCAYHEVKLIHKANRKAEKEGKVLIYRDEDGGFSLYHPQTPAITTNWYKDFIRSKRALYKYLADSNRKIVTQPSEDDLKAKLENYTKDDINKSHETFRLFSSKNRNLTPTTPRKDLKPVPIVTKFGL